MKIIRIDVYKSPLKLKEPFIISLGPLEVAENIIVKIETDSGLTGFGECSPFRTIHGESMDTGYVVARYLSNTLIGKDPLQTEECSNKMDQAIFGNACVKSAFSIAIYDLASQFSQQPLCEFLGGKKNKKLVTDYTISFDTPEKMAADAVKIISNGFKIIKVKLGGTADDDLLRIKAIRQSVGNDIQLRIDANQGWTSENAIGILNSLAPYVIQHCEEPLPKWDFLNLANISAQSPIPVMADESCCDHHDATRLIQLKSCGLFNIKLSKSSGFTNALKIIRLAEEAAIQLQVGGFLESRLGFTAAAHLAYCSDNILFCDFDTPLMLMDDPVIDGIIYGQDGEVTLTDLYGLGAKFDDDYLAGLEKFSVLI